MFLSGCFLLKAHNSGLRSPTPIRWFAALIISLVFSVFLYNLFSLFQDISRYPFTLGWSETSRYYYASLFLSERLYGIQTPPSVLHPSRYLMQAAPYLLPGSSLWMHRAWQVFLWISTSLVTAFILARRLGFGKNQLVKTGLFIAWVFVFLMIGPVYYHLQIPLILVLWGFNRDSSARPAARFARNVLIVAAASAWAGISRVNWYPVPGLLAAALFFLEQPIQPGDQKDAPQEKLFAPLLSWRVLRYGLAAVAWTVFGTAVAFAAQTAYVLWSGNNAREFTSSFSSDLLWYRLWPSSTYPIGILPGILLVSFPLWLAAWDSLRKITTTHPVWKDIHPIRWLGLSAILLVLFAGGLVVSVKIGGGSNLHNMDAYLSLLLVIVSFVVYKLLRFDRTTQAEPNSTLDQANVAGEVVPASREVQPHTNLSNASIILNITMVCLFTLFSRSAMPNLPDQETTTRALSIITRAIDSLKKPDPQVLFLTDRHLLTFGYVQGVKLIPEYERVFLMEMAMSGQPEYLDRFHSDLSNHRFDLIISEPLYLQEKGQGEQFGEENDAWVDQVSEEVLCYYKPRTLIKDVRIQILIPRTNPGACRVNSADAEQGT